MIDLLQRLQETLRQNATTRYRFSFNKKASVALRRSVFPHKWRGLSRSQRHLRSVRSFLNTLEHTMNTADAYRQIDDIVAQRINL